MQLAPLARLSPRLLAAALLLSSAAPAQQVLWKDNPISGKVVGLTYGTSGWNAAEAHAVAYGGHLVTIRNSNENDWLRSTSGFSTVWAPNGIGPWIGLNDFATEGSFVWSSGESAAWSGGFPWAPGEPSGGGFENGVCLAYLNQNWLWHDAAQGSNFRSLIEVSQRPARSWSWPTGYGVGAIPHYGSILDIDGDGYADYASPDRDSGQVSIWRNTGIGTFTPASVVGGCGSVHTTASADWDGDGDEDLLAADSGGRLLFLKNDGAGWSLQPALASVPVCHGVALGDFNADGRVDVATTSVGSDDRVRVFLRQPDGSLAAPLVYGPFFDEAYQPTLADLDLDGLLDLIIAGGGVRLLRGSPSGAFNDGGNLGSGRSVRCAAADLDGDGRKEVLTSRIDTDVVEVWISTSAGTLSATNFSLAQSLPCGDGPHWIEAGDLDGDGDPDVVVPSNNSDTVHVLRNTPNGLAQDHVLAGQDYALYTAIADFNGDAKPDILSSNAFANAFGVHLNQSIFDCNGNGIDDPLDVSSGFAQDCNGNGRPDSCDLALGFAQDSNGNGFLDECEPTLVSITPAVGAAFASRTVTLALTNIPDGAATLELASPAFATPLVRSISVQQGSATVTLPPLAAPSASDVVAAGLIRFLDANGASVATAATPAAFTWNVPEIVSSVPNNAPFDQTTGVVFRLRDHVATSGLGTATFGSAAPQAAFLFLAGGDTWVSTTAPAQPAPGPVNVLLRFGSELTLAQRGFVYLGPGIASLSATEGWQAGGEPLDVELYGFAPGVPVQVRFGLGAQAALALGTPLGTSTSATVSLVTPQAASSGALDLEVVQFAGQPNEKRASSPGAWLARAPRVLGVTPSSAFQGGGETLVVALEGLAPAQPTQVELGTQVHVLPNVGTLAASTVTLATQLWPSPGPVTVRARQQVGTPGELGASLAAALDVIGPALASVLPASGPLEGGTQVVAQTSGFDPSQSAQVQVGGATLVGTVSGSGSAQTVAFRTRLATASGPSAVTISQGVLTATLPAAFTFDPARVIPFCQPKLTSAGTTPVIGFSGSPSLSTGDFALTLSNALPDKYCLYFFGELPLNNTPFYGGKLCVAQNIKRGPTVQTTSGSSATCPFPVTPALVGQNRYFQWWFRDPADPFTVGLSGGLRVLGFYP